MKISISKKDLLSLVARGQGVADKKSPMPAAGHLLLTAEKGSLRVAATDLYIGIESSAPCEVLTAGSVALPARDLIERVKSMPEGALTVDVDPDSSKCLIKTVGSARRHTLSGIPGREYPVLPQPGSDHAFITFPASTLVAMFAQTDFAASTDTSRPNMNGVLLEWGEGLIRAVAIDGHRLSLAEAQSDIDSCGSLVVPLKAVGEIKRLLESSDAPTVDVALNGSCAFFRTPLATLSVQLANVSFPPWRQIVPTYEKASGAFISRDSLADAAACVGIASDAVTGKGLGGGVLLTLSAQKLTVDAESSDSGPSHDEIPMNYDGKDKLLRMNHRYLLDALSAVDCDEIELCVGGELDPVLMRPTMMPDGRSFSATIMPLHK